MINKPVLLFIVFFLSVYTPYLRAQEVTDNSVVSGNIIVMVDSEEALQFLTDKFPKINNLVSSLKVKSALSKNMQIYLLEFDHLSINSNWLLAQLRSLPFVKIAQFNHKVSWRNTPDDTFFTDQWSLDNTGQNGGTAGADISALDAWEITTGGLTSQGDSIVVAVIDGGFDVTHEDLNFWKNYHEIPNNSIDDDGNGYVDDFDGWSHQNLNDNLPVQSHGTHVSGIIGAKGANTNGITGVNWNIKVMPVSSDGNTEADVVASYSYVLEQRRLYNQTNGAKGAFVVATNSSFGIDLGQPVNFPLWCAMYDSLGKVGILSVAATANSNTNVDTQGDIPTACGSNWLVTVTNTTNTDTKWNAGYGATTIDLGAPGRNILSTVLNNNYQEKTGTSQATPHVTGAIALMYSVGCQQFMTDYKSKPDSIALIVKDSLLASTDTIPALKNITVTGGRLNLYKAVNSILNLYPSDSCVINPSRVVPDTVKEDIPSLRLVKMYPIPTWKELYIDYYAKKAATLKVYNVLGEIVTEFDLPASDELAHAVIDINAAGLTSGIYLFEMINADGRIKGVKVVVY